MTQLGKRIVKKFAFLPQSVEGQRIWFSPYYIVELGGRYNESYRIGSNGVGFHEVDHWRTIGPKSLNVPNVNDDQYKD